MVVISTVAAAVVAMDVSGWPLSARQNLFAGAQVEVSHVGLVGRPVCSCPRRPARVAAVGGGLLAVYI